ncbi:MAG: hypothetical protein ACK4OF_07775 [Aquificaceae bacterium]
MLTKDIASSYVIARRGLGMKEKMPKTYMDLFNKLGVEELKELREYVKKEVKNQYLRSKHIKEIDHLIKSLEGKPKRVFRRMEGTSPSTHNRDSKGKAAFTSLTIWAQEATVGVGVMAWVYMSKLFFEHPENISYA